MPGVYLKPALVQAAHAAVKSTKSVYFKSKYERISKRRGKKRAIIAIARMILTAVFAMLKTGEVFNPCDLQKYDMPEQLKRKQIVSSAKDAVKFLVSLGVLQGGYRFARRVDWVDHSQFQSPFAGLFAIPFLRRCLVCRCA